MHPPPQELVRLAAALCADPASTAVACRAQSEIESGRGVLLFRALVEHVREELADPAEVSPRVMKILEATMCFHDELAAYLMGRLYMTAGRYGNYDIPEGIRLWMHHSVSLSVACGLVRLSKEKEQVRPLLRKQCETWAARILARTKPGRHDEG